MVTIRLFRSLALSRYSVMYDPGQVEVGGGRGRCRISRVYELSLCVLVISPRTISMSAKKRVPLSAPL